MRQVLRLLMVTGLLALAGGCASMTGSPPAPFPKEVRNNLAQELSYDKMNTYLEGYMNADCSNSAATEAVKKKNRDALTTKLIFSIDLQYAAFRTQLYADVVGGGFASDIAILGLTTAGAVAGTERATQILSSLAAGIAGAKFSFDKNAFYNQAMPAVVHQMDVNRQAALIPLKEGLANSTAEYPLFQALTDVSNYYYAGTMAQGLSQLGTVPGNTSQAELEKINMRMRAQLASIKNFNDCDNYYVSYKNSFLIRNIPSAKDSATKLWKKLSTASANMSNCSDLLQGNTSDFKTYSVCMSESQLDTMTTVLNNTFISNKSTYSVSREALASNATAPADYIAGLCPPSK